MSKSKKEEFQDGPSPNIAFVGKGEPITAFVDGSKAFQLPEDQAKPFFHKEAARIISLFPKLYKPVVEK